MDNCFPKKSRILKRNDFISVKKMGCKKTTSHFVLYYSATNALYPRLGITVSKKYGNAVKRNRQKRIIREYFRTNEKKLENYSYVLIVKQNIYTKTHSMIVNELNELFTNT